MAILLVLIVNIITHLAFFGHPTSVVFDEVHYGTFLSHYLTGSYLFDVHPPLARLLFLLFAKMIGITSPTDFSLIGTELPESFLLLRLLPTIAGILLPFVIYGICRKLNLSKMTSAFAALLLSLENSLIVQSRFIMADSLLLLFGFTSLLFYLMSRDSHASQRRKLLFYILSLTMVAAAISIKWTAASFILIILLMEVYFIFRKSENSSRNDHLFESILRWLGSSGMMFVIIIIIYAGTFAIHFNSLLHTGPGDAFMSPRFLKTIENSQYYVDPNIIPRGPIGKFMELNFAMLDAHTRLLDQHNYSSQWYTWPFMYKPIYYWQNANIEGQSEKQAHIYFLGNPLIYWLGSIAAAGLVIYLVSISTNGRLRSNLASSPIILFVALGYFANLLPFMGINRVMFMYHYAPSLIFSVIAIAMFTEMISSSKKRVAVMVIITIVTIASFLFFSPLTYGLPVTENELQARMWVKSWR